MKKLLKAAGYIIGSAVGAYAIYFLGVIGYGLAEYVISGDRARGQALMHAREAAHQQEEQRSPATQ